MAELPKCLSQWLMLCIISTEWDHQRGVTVKKLPLSFTHTFLTHTRKPHTVCIRLSSQCFVCKQDINSHVIVLVQCVWLWAFPYVCVSWSGIHPCVLWTLCVRVLADISKRSRSAEAVRQDIPSLSYRLPLLLWHTYRDPSSPCPLPPPLTFLIALFSAL